VCKKEIGFKCKDGNLTAPSKCQEVCGDGINMGFLACDDGNLLDGDGCSAKCEEEIFWHCYGGSPNAPDSCINTVKTQRLA
jgi:cysteine-rich repeat protein